MHSYTELLKILWINKVAGTKYLYKLIWGQGCFSSQSLYETLSSVQNDYFSLERFMQGEGKLSVIKF